MYSKLCFTTYVAVQYQGPRSQKITISVYFRSTCINKMASDHKAGESVEALAIDLRFYFE